MLRWGEFRGDRPSPGRDSGDTHLNTDLEDALREVSKSLKSASAVADENASCQPEHLKGRSAAPAGRGHPSVCVGTLRGHGAKPEKGIRLAAPLRAKMKVQHGMDSTFC